MMTASGNRAAEEHRTMQVLTFVMGGDVFGVPIQQVREIIEFDGLTQVPTMPRHLRGVIRLRGTVVPIVDLQVRFGRAETVIARRTCVVIVEVHQGGAECSLGILVDAVNEVLAVERDSLTASPTVGGGLRSEFVSGILNLENRLVVVLDIDKILSEEEMDGLAALAPSGTR